MKITHTVIRLINKICCCIIIFDLLVADLAGVLAFNVAWLEQFPAKPGRLAAAFLRWPLGHVLNSMENKK